LFSEDRYHPSAAGYALVSEQLLPALCNALGESTGGLAAELPSASGAARTGVGRIRLRILSRLWRRPTTGVPAPVVVPTGG
jgi:hypothetical protein